MTYYQRHLPHWHPEGKSLFVTWRLYGSLPAGVHFGSRAGILACHSGAPGTRQAGMQSRQARMPVLRPGEAFLKADRELDRASIGPLWLKNPRVAQCVVDALLFGESQLNIYELCNYVVMPNHVHVLLRPNVPLARITKVLKGYTACQANQILSRVGKRFWQEESYDHWVRDANSMNRIAAYIERNPVSAGLVERIEDWPWSSAAK